MSPGTKASVALTLLLAIASIASPTEAQVNEEVVKARQLVRNGQKHLAKRQYDRALDAFELADQLVAKSVTRLGVAQALEGLGRLVEARKAALSVEKIPAELHEHSKLVEARRRAAALVRSLNERVAYLNVVIRPSTVHAIVLLDGKRMSPSTIYSVPIDPGRHVVQIRAKRYRLTGKTFTIESGQRKTVLLQLTPLQEVVETQPAPAFTSVPIKNETIKNESIRTPRLGGLTWTGIASVSLGLLVGVPTGAVGLRNIANLRQACTLGPDGSSCPNHLHSARRHAQDLVYVSTTAIAFSAVGIGTSLVGLFAVDRVHKPKTEVTLAPIAGPAMLGVRGTFE